MIQILHLAIILIFSFLDFHNILIGHTEYPFYVDFPEFISFLKFILSYIIAHYIKRLLGVIGLRVFMKKNKMKQEHIIVMQFVVDFLQFFIALKLVPVLDGKAILFSRYIFFIILMLICHVILNFFTEKFGLFELYFGLIISPIIILWTQSILFKYCLIRSIFNVGPITLQYIPLVLFYPRDFKAYGHDDVNKIYRGIDQEILNPIFTYPLSKLFGRQDSFRFIFIIFLYCCFDIFWDCWTTGNSEY